MEAVIASTLSRWFTSDTKLSRPDLIDRVTKTLLADDPMVHAAIWDKIADFDVHEQLREIRCPAIVLVGDVRTDGNRSVYQLREHVALWVCVRL